MRILAIYFKVLSSKNRFICLAVCCLLSCSSLFAQTYLQTGIQENDIKNRAYLLNLQERACNNEQIEKQEFDESHFAFPFTSFGSFKNALSEFLFSKDQKNTFIDYQVVDSNISGKLQISVGGGVDYHTSSDSSYVHLYRRVKVRGNIHNRLVFWGDWWAGRFQGDLSYAENSSPLIKGWHKPHEAETQKYTNLNRLSGQISYLFNYGNVSIGRGVHHLNDNISGSIILNDDTNDYGYFSSELTFGKLRLSFLHASLIPNQRDPIYSDAYHGVYYVDKFLAQHQLNYTPTRNLDIYFGEQVVYANRGIEISYLLPHTFYRITEHNLHDRDNVVIYAGGRWKVKSCLSLYGSLMLDELKKSEIFGDWWGNKYALQGGISSKFLKGFIDADNEEIEATVEFTAVRPWTYTHKNYMTNHSHDGTGLGFPSGSNIVEGAAQLVLPVFPYLQYAQFVAVSKQGSLGNNWSLNYYDDRKDETGAYIDTAKWLEGDVTDTIKSRSVLTFSLFTHHSIKVGAELVWVDKEKPVQEYVLSCHFMY